MGAISGLIMFGIGFWFHKSVIDANAGLPDEEKRNGFTWFGIGSGVYLAGLLLGMVLNWLFLAGEIDVPVGDESGQATGGDSGAVGIISELMPIFLGLAAAYITLIIGVKGEKLKLPAFIADKLAKK